MVGNTCIDHRNGDALARHTGDGAEAKEKTRRAGAHLIGSRGCARHAHERRDRRVARQHTVRCIRGQLRNLRAVGHENRRVFHPARDGKAMSRCHRLDVRPRTADDDARSCRCSPALEREEVVRQLGAMPLAGHAKRGAGNQREDRKKLQGFRAAEILWKSHDWSSHTNVASHGARREPQRRPPSHVPEAM